MSDVPNEYKFPEREDGFLVVRMHGGLELKSTNNRSKAEEFAKEMAGDDGMAVLIPCTMFYGPNKSPNSTRQYPN